ncbi:MAG: ParB/RepB/Spo0J family partition protein [Pyrinomonadaceae bacterium]
MSKRGLPVGIKMRHDSHYVEDLARSQRTVGKIIPINQIAPNPEQPRTEIGDLTELSSSIKQNGVLEPLLVKPNGDGSFMIIAGERRWRAANLAGLPEVPCIELDIDEQSIAEIALIENLQRKDLTVWEEADGLAYLAERFGYTHEEIAKKIGKSRTTVTESMSVAGLPESIREKCRRADIASKSTLLEIARQFDEAAMHEFLDNLQNKTLIPKAVRPKKSNTADKNKTTEIENGGVENNTDFPHAATDINTFRYVSANKIFNLEIRFNKLLGYEKRDVLRALKEVFDSVKN